MDEIQGIFFEECAEGLAVAEQGLSAMRAGDLSSETIAGVFRAVHSIKGGAGAFGYWPLQGFTHTFETLLSDVREGTVPLEDDLVELLLRGAGYGQRPCGGRAQRRPVACRCGADRGT